MHTDMEFLFESSSQYISVETEVSEGQLNVSEHFLEIPKDYHKFPMITKDFLGRWDHVVIIQHHIYYNYSLRNLIRNHSNSDLFTCGNNMLFSCVKISCFCLNLAVHQVI